MKEIRSLKLKIAPEVRSATHCVMSSSTGLLVRCAMSRAVGQRAEDAPCMARISNSRSRADRCSGSARATSLGAGTAGSRAAVPGLRFGRVGAFAAGCFLTSGFLAVTGLRASAFCLVGFVIWAGDGLSVDQLGEAKPVPKITTADNRIPTLRFIPLS